MNSLRVGFSALLFLSALSILNPVSTSPNQLTTVTYFTATTTVYTSRSYSFSTSPFTSIIYSGSFKIPQLSNGGGGVCAISAYAIGPFPASSGDQVSTTGSTDYPLTATLWPQQLWGQASGFLNQINSGNPDQSQAACGAYYLWSGTISNSVKVFQVNATGPSSLDLTYNMGDLQYYKTGEYYLVLETDGSNVVDIALTVNLTTFTVYTSTISFTPTTTVTSIGGYWVGQALLYPIVENLTLLILGGALGLAICLAVLVLRKRRKTPS